MGSTRPNPIQSMWVELDLCDRLVGSKNLLNLTYAAMHTPKCEDTCCYHVII